MTAPRWGLSALNSATTFGETSSAFTKLNQLHQRSNAIREQRFTFLGCSLRASPTYMCRIHRVPVHHCSNYGAAATAVAVNALLKLRRPDPCGHVIVDAAHQTGFRFTGMTQFLFIEDMVFNWYDRRISQNRLHTVWLFPGAFAQNKIKIAVPCPLIRMILSILLRYISSQMFFQQRKRQVAFDDPTARADEPFRGLL